MVGKTKVKFIYNSAKKWDAGEVGYIDGYVEMGGWPAAVVVLKHSFMVVSLDAILAVNEEHYQKEINKL